MKAKSNPQQRLGKVTECETTEYGGQISLIFII